MKQMQNVTHKYLITEKTQIWAWQHIPAAALHFPLWSFRFGQYGRRQESKRGHYWEVFIFFTIKVWQLVWSKVEFCFFPDGWADNSLTDCSCSDPLFDWDWYLFGLVDQTVMQSLFALRERGGGPYTALTSDRNRKCAEGNKLKAPGRLHPWKHDPVYYGVGYGKLKPPTFWMRASGHMTNMM